jgi:hypothetical protein
MSTWRWIRAIKNPQGIGLVAGNLKFMVIVGCKHTPMIFTVLLMEKVIKTHIPDG